MPIVSAISVGVQVFLIPQNHRHARRLRQGGDQPAQHPAQHRIARGGAHRGLSHIRKRHLGTPLAFARGIDGALHRNLAQPVCGMRGRFNSRQILMQAEENVLRDLLRQVAVMQKMPGHAEHHSAVFAHQPAEIQCLPCRRQSNHFSFARYVTLLLTLVR